MQNKCFLYIDNYPRNAGDVPFIISIDWGDGSAVESYRLHVEKVPTLYHIYETTGSYEITVTITNKCGTSTRVILYEPYVPSDEDCLCANTEIENRSNFIAELDDATLNWDISVKSCFTDVKYDPEDELIKATLRTDVSVNLPLLIFPAECLPLYDGTLDLTTRPIPASSAVNHVWAHLGPMFGGITDPGDTDGPGDYVTKCPYIDPGPDAVAMYLQCGHWNLITNRCNHPRAPGGRICAYFEAQGMLNCPDGFTHPWLCEKDHIEKGTPYPMNSVGFCSLYNAQCPCFVLSGKCPYGIEEEPHEIQDAHGNPVSIIGLDECESYDSAQGLCVEFNRVCPVGRAGVCPRNATDPRDCYTKYLTQYYSPTHKTCATLGALCPLHDGSACPFNLGSPTSCGRYNNPQCNVMNAPCPVGSGSSGNTGSAP